MRDQGKAYYAYYQCPSALLKIHSNGSAIVKIERIKTIPSTPDHPDKYCKQAKDQLDQYFSGERQEFDVPLDLSAGTDFQQIVWNALRKINFGKTTSYGQLAHAINNPKAVRAVGTANGKNPILIMVPCHRVIGADGSLTGFSAGIDMKKQLLELECAKELGRQASLF